jgi:hypothetical protein
MFHGFGISSLFESTSMSITIPHATLKTQVQRFRLKQKG